MGMEILGDETQPGQVTVADGEDGLSPDVKNKANVNLVQESSEPAVFGLDDCTNGANGLVKEMDPIANSKFPTDAVDEWPAPKQIHSFYFVKFRSYDDPKLKAKIDQADKEIQKRNQARYQITEALKAKRGERANVISQLKPLTAEKKQYNEALNEKIKEIEPLQSALGKIRNANNAVREKGVGLCSSEEELNDLIKSLHYRISHESISLDEEKHLLKDIKQLEGTRGKVIANAAMRAKVQDSAVQKEAIQDQVKLIGADLDGVRKERQAINAKIKPLEDQLKVIEDEISSLQNELASVTEKKDKAFENLNELRKARDVANACYFQNRSLLNTAKDLAAKKDVSALEQLSLSEREKIMAQWSSSKGFREDYERRVLPTFNGRQLSRDGRMRNPDEKPIVSEGQQATELETAPLKVAVKQAKGAVTPTMRAGTAPAANEFQDKETSKVAEANSKAKAGHSEDAQNRHETEKTHKELPKSNEVDPKKLKEMKREEEIVKNKMALERKKKLADRSAVKAASRAQKEEEKKLKEKEKKAKKKAGGSAPAGYDEQIESDTKADEEAEGEEKSESPVPSKTKEHKEKIRHRGIQKSKNQLLQKAILKRKKSHAYNWSWAAPAAISAAFIAVVLASCGYYYYYYLPKGN